jgi:hypothetical protein
MVQKTASRQLKKQTETKDEKRARQLFAKKQAEGLFRAMGACFFLVVLLIVWTNWGLR